jgi:sugar lactone lactonase YvrE
MIPEPGSAPCSGITSITPTAWLSTRKAVYTAAAPGRSIVLLEADDTVTIIVDQRDSTPLNTPNDLAIDPQGQMRFNNS